MHSLWITRCNLEIFLKGAADVEANKSKYLQNEGQNMWLFFEIKHLRFFDFKPAICLTIIIDLTLTYITADCQHAVFDSFGMLIVLFMFF